MNKLSTFPVIIQQTVAWGDMDAYQHVNNVMYFRYFESARLAYFREMGFRRTHDAHSDTGPILAHTACSFLQPLVYPDTVEIGCKVTKIGNTSFVLQHEIWSPTLGLAASGEGVVVCYDFKNKHKIPVPDELRRRIEAIEGRKF